MKKGLAYSIISILAVAAIALGVLYFTNNNEKSNQIALLDADITTKEGKIEGLIADIDDKENQIKELIHSSLCSVFFIDEDQRVTMDDIGSVDQIKRWAREADSHVYEMELVSQFRCNGSDTSCGESF